MALTRPSVLCWDSDGVLSTVSACTGHADGSPCRNAISVYANSATFQMSYRVRKRYNYAHTENVYGEGVSPDMEVWSEWGAWTEHNNGNPFTATLIDGFYARLLEVEPTEQEWSGYDCIQWEVKVRACTSNLSQTTDWLSGTLSLYPAITWGIEYVTTYSDSILFRFTSDWLRGGTLYMHDDRFYPSHADPQDGMAYLTRQLVKWPKPNEQYGIVKSYMSSKGCTIDEATEFLFNESVFEPRKHESGNRWVEWQYSIDMTQPAHPTAVDVPTIAVVDDDRMGTVVRVSDGDWDNVWGTLVWEQDGTDRTEPLDFAKNSDDRWRAKVPFLPYDIPVRARVTVQEGNAWNTYYHEFSVPSNGVITLYTATGERIDLVLYSERDGNMQVTYEPDRETVVLAGRERPVARYGAAQRRTFTLSNCAVLTDRNEWRNPPKQSDARQLEHITDNGDITMAAPRGVVMQVMVKRRQKTIFREYELYSIEFEEVC